MSYKYFTVLTDVGKQKLAEAIANETALDFTEMAVGDSNGTSYEPTSDMTALKHVTYRAAIGSMKINAEDKNVMEFEFVVPASTGGFYIREAGLYSSDGTLIAISRLPEQYKADMAEGAGSSMTVRILVAISSDAQIYITVPASITYATKTYVTEEFKKHKADSNPHEQYVLNETYSAKIDELQKNINSKAANTHNHDSTYLKKTDASSTYATKSELSDGLAGKAATNHSHSNYAANNHNHDSVYFKKADILPVTSGGNGNNQGLSQGLKMNKIIQEDNWLSDNTQGVFPLFWQTSDYASKKLPYTAGALLKSCLTSNLKSALAFDLGNAYVSIFDFKQNRWKQIAFNDDVVNKMPKVSKDNGIGYLQQIGGQGAPVTYRLPSDGAYFYFLTCTNDYNNYNAVDNKVGIAEGGSEIISASMNKKTFGGFIWRIQ